MKHLKTVSKTPARAADIPVSSKLQFVISVLNAFTPLLVAKETQPTT
jgi:hypothetical protein